MAVEIQQTALPWQSSESLEALKSQGSDLCVEQLQKIRGVILLGGAVRPPALSLMTGRSILDLPVDEDHTFMQHWLLQVRELTRWLGCQKMRARVLLAKDSIKPRRPMRTETVSLRVERDRVGYRGIGGVLRDLSVDYQEDDHIVVANAAQLLLAPLPQLITELARGGEKNKADVSLISHHDGTPSGLMLIRCGALACIPKVGFVDMKEQALGIIADHHRVNVVQPPLLSAIPVRTLSDYISALRWHHQQAQMLANPERADDPFAEDWQPQFRIVEQGADVDRSAHIHDSVILRGGKVEAGATVVRSVVGPGGVLRGQSVCADRLVSDAESS